MRDLMMKYRRIFSESDQDIGLTDVLARRIDTGRMQLNALVDSFCHDQKKCGTERVKATAMYCSAAVK